MYDLGEWPARCYVYGTWVYAYAQTVDRSKRAGLKMYVYKGVLDGEPVWIGSWDPKR